MKQHVYISVFLLLLINAHAIQTSERKYLTKSVDGGSAEFMIKPLTSGIHEDVIMNRAEQRVQLPAAATLQKLLAEEIGVHFLECTSLHNQLADKQLFPAEISNKVTDALRCYSNMAPDWSKTKFTRLVSTFYDPNTIAQNIIAGLPKIKAE